jgi:ribosomal protein S18 acetylase RimI-like enzyme
MIAALRRRRWRRPGPEEFLRLFTLLERWPGTTPGSIGGVRNMFLLAAMELGGAGMVRICGDPELVRPDGSVGVGVIVRAGREVITVAGDAHAVREAVGPVPTWRLLVGERAACDAVLEHGVQTGRIVHEQRLLVVDPDAVPGLDEVADPGCRRAVADDLERLADLAVQLHVDDGFGPDPGPQGHRGYLSRLSASVRAGTVDCVGPVGAPVAKLERSVQSPRWGVQLAGIVVDPAHRGQGIGRGLVAGATRVALAAGARAVTLHTRSANASALRAYGAAGFLDVEPWRLAVRP